MKKSILFTLSILILGLILTNISCEKLDVKRVTKIKTGEVSGISYYSATVQGTIIDVGENPGEVGHCWDTISPPDINSNKQAISNTPNKDTGITTEINNLKPDHTYYTRAYATSDKEPIYGETVEFKTSKLPNFTLSLTFPLQESLWPINKTSTIKWNTDISGAFTLTLLKQEAGNFVDLAEIGTTSEGAREFEYILAGEGVTAGNYYAIRIESIDVSDFYDLKTFKATDPGISMIDPNANSKWNMGGEYTLKWNSTDIDRLDIKLFKNSIEISPAIADSQLNNQGDTHQWDIPLSLEPGTDYQIGVYYSDYPEVYEMSDLFEILSEKSISITAPTAGVDWQMGNTYDITWSDNITENVRIELFKDGDLDREIAGSILSNGTHSWTIPTGMVADNDYTIKVTMIGDDSVVDDSEQFTISEVSGSVGTVTDYDNNTYPTVKIGNQWWMAENLKVTKYADGSAIGVGEVTDNTTWANLGDNDTDKAYCYYNNNASNEADTYGALYTYAAAMNGTSSSTTNPSGVQGICPTSWHLPSDDEWKELEMYLGMSQVDADATGLRGTDEGGKLKEAGTTHWTSPNTGAINESGFLGLPGGYRSSIGGGFNYVSNYGGWWCTTENNGTTAWYRHLYHDNSGIEYANNNKSGGFSVRCVKD